MLNVGTKCPHGKRKSNTLVIHYEFCVGISSEISRISYPASCIRAGWGLPEYMSWVFVWLRFHILWLKWDLCPLSLLAPCLALTQWTFDTSPNLPASGGTGGQGRCEAQRVLSEGWSSLEWKPWCLVSGLDQPLCSSWRCKFTWAAGLQVSPPKPPFYHSTALPPLLLLLSRFSCIRLCATAAHQALPSLGFSRQLLPLRKAQRSRSVTGVQWLPFSGAGPVLL